MLMGIKRIYEKPSITDGKRVFVDRLWPRGVKKSTSNIDVWMKDVAPSDELREWFAHDPRKWDGFVKKYRKELGACRKFEDLVSLVMSNDVTLLYSAKDTEHNNAVALAIFLKERKV